MSGKKRPEAGADDALWERAMREVEPLRRRRPKKPAEPSRPPEQRPTANKKAADKAPRRVTARQDTPERLQSAGRTVPGLDQRSADRLRRGRLPIEARLDLHGMRQAPAHRLLSAFIESQAAAGRRCVLVITGKGTRSPDGAGVLRATVPKWLAEPALAPMVLAIRPAQPRDGGTGAYYVLLRRRRRSTGTRDNSESDH